jgi:hypothetical protein
MDLLQEVLLLPSMCDVLKERTQELTKRSAERKKQQRRPSGRK